MTLSWNLSMTKFGRNPALGTDASARLVNPSEILLSAVAMFAPVAAVRAIEVFVRIDDKLAEIVADCARLHRAVANLLAAALQSTPAGGLITAVVERDGDGARFSVSDSGSGIDPTEVIESLRSVPSESSGTRGMGLALTRRLVESQGGDMCVEIQQSHGTRVSFTLRTASPIEDTTENRDHPFTRARTR